MHANVQKNVKEETSEAYTLSGLQGKWCKHNSKKQVRSQERPPRMTKYCLLLAMNLVLTTH